MSRLVTLLSAAALAACAPETGAGNETAVLAPPTDAAPARAGAEPALVDTIPAAFHGTYDRDAEACAGPSEYSLRIEGKALRFHESVGKVRGVAVEGPRAVTVIADYQGEGESWSNVRRMELSDDAQALTISGQGLTISRVRCPAAPRWHGSASGEGAGLGLGTAEGKRVITLFCPAGSPVLLVNVPGFRPVGSEERMSFGAGGTVTTLVADTRGDRLRGGVSGEGAVPAELAAILADPAGLAVNYGSQNLGPLARVPAAQAKDFVAGCGG